MSERNCTHCYADGLKQVQFKCKLCGFVLCKECAIVINYDTIGNSSVFDMDICRNCYNTKVNESFKSNNNGGR